MSLDSLREAARQENEAEMAALRRAIDRANGVLRNCPDCKGTGEEPNAFGYCIRCDGHGEIRVLD